MNKSRGVNVDKIFSNLETIKKTAGVTASLVGYSTLGKDSARVFIKSARELGLEETREFVFEAFQHTLIPFNASFSIKDGVSSVIVYRNAYKTLEAKANLVQLNANSYLDVELNEVWESKTVDGNVMFVRENTDEINKVLSDLHMTASQMYRIEANAMLCNVEASNVIEFFAKTKDSADIAVGIVSSVNADTVDVFVGSQQLTIPRHAVLRVIAATSVDEVLEYLSKAYPQNPEYLAYIKNMR